MISFLDETKGNRYGFINSNDEVVIETYFRNIQAFKNGRAVVAMPNMKYGFIDANSTKNKNPKKIQFAIPPKYYFAKSFSENLAAVSDGNCYFYINTKGETVFPDLCVSDAGYFSNGLAIINNNGRMGILKNTGEYLLAPQYEKLTKISDTLFYGQLDETTFHLINTNGNIDFKSQLPFELFEPYAIEKDGDYIYIVNTFNPESKFSIPNCSNYKVYFYTVACQQEKTTKYYNIETQSEIVFSN